MTNWRTGLVCCFGCWTVAVSPLVSILLILIISGSFISFFRIYFYWLRMCSSSGSRPSPPFAHCPLSLSTFSLILFSSYSTSCFILAILSTNRRYSSSLCCCSYASRLRRSYSSAKALCYCSSWAWRRAYSLCLSNCSSCSRFSLYYRSFFSLADFSMRSFSSFSLRARSNASTSLFLTFSFYMISRSISYSLRLLSSSLLPRSSFF